MDKLLWTLLWMSFFFSLWELRNDLLAADKVTENVYGQYNLQQPQACAAYLVGINSHTFGCRGIVLCGCPTHTLSHKPCEGAVDPPVGWCVITNSVKFGAAPPFSVKQEGCKELGLKPNQPWAKGALCWWCIRLHRWKHHPASAPFTSAH